MVDAVGRASQTIINRLWMQKRPHRCTPIQRIRPLLSREECELADVEKAMEENLILDHQRPERVVGMRTTAEGTTQYLVKVRS